MSNATIEPIEQRIERREHTLRALKEERYKLMRQIARSDDAAFDIQLADVEDSIASCERVLSVLADQVEADVRERRQRAEEEAVKQTIEARRTLVEMALQRVQRAEKLDAAALAFVRELMEYRAFGDTVHTVFDQILRSLPGSVENHIDRSLIFTPVARGRDVGHTAALAGWVGRMISALDSEMLSQSIELSSAPSAESFVECASYSAKKLEGFARVH